MSNKKNTARKAGESSGRYLVGELFQADTVVIQSTVICHKGTPKQNTIEEQMSHV